MGADDPGVVVPRHRCVPCRRVWRHSITAAVLSRGKLSRDAIMVAVKSVVVDRVSIARVSASLGVAWNTASDAILAAGTDNADRLEGVTTVGVDERVRRRTRAGGKDVTVIIDLTLTRTKTGASRLLAVAGADRSRHSSPGSTPGPRRSVTG